MNLDEQARAWRGDHDALRAIIAVAEARRGVWAAIGHALQTGVWEGLLDALRVLTSTHGPPESLRERLEAVSSDAERIDESSALGAWTSPSGRTVTVALEVTIGIRASGIESEDRGWFLEDVLPAVGQLAEAKLRDHRVRLAGSNIRWEG